jgi:hypothetical protein
VVLVDFFSAPWRAWVRVGSEAGSWRKGMACGGLVVKRAWQVPESGGWAICRLRGGFCEIALRASIKKGVGCG